MSSVTTENVLAAELVLTIKTGVSTCTTAGFDTNGTPISVGILGSTTGTKVFGDSALGFQPGDRDLAVGANEVLCAQGVLPTTTNTTSQTKTRTATLTFDAELDIIDPVLSGTLAGTTLADGTAGFADTLLGSVVSLAKYTGTGLNFTDTGLQAGTSYTYTVTAVGPGSVSSILGPFAP